MPPVTIPELFEQSVARYANNPLMWEKKGDRYVSSTYRETHDAVIAFAGGLIALGVQKGDRIALIAEGRNDWVISELGIFYAGAVNVPLSVKLHEGADLEFRLAHAGCRMIIASGPQAMRVRPLRKSLPELRWMVVLDPLERYEPGELPADDVMRRGKETVQDGPSAVQERRQSVKGEDPATICYTSGTTADPKGVVLTHRNYTANVEQASGLLPIPEWYCSLLILPWDHCFAHVAGIYTLIRNGASMASVQMGRSALETVKNIPQNIRESRPTFLLSVPALARNFKKGIESAVAAKGRAAFVLFTLGMAIATAYNGDGWSKGRGARVLLKPLVRLFDLILFRKIRENFGGRLEFFIEGGALLDIEIQRFFFAIGIPMFQGYGLSEATPIISSNVPARHKLGSSGSLVPNLDIRICDDAGHELPMGSHGEIVVRGENVMAGYWRNEKATRETVRDGWLYTGDLGYLDSDRFLYVLGRTKSLLIANDGEKYSPEGIEETLCSGSRYIDQLMLYNNQSPFTVALLVPDKEAVLGWMKGHGHLPGSWEGQCAALQLLQREIDACRSGGQHAGLFPERWLPASVGVLAEGFTEQNGLLNSTMKMVRRKIAETYEPQIQSLFTAEGKSICNRNNCAVIAGWADTHAG